MYVYLKLKEVRNESQVVRMQYNKAEEERGIMEVVLDWCYLI